jgi:hypothetical protein
MRGRVSGRAVRCQSPGGPACLRAFSRSPRGGLRPAPHGDLAPRARRPGAAADHDRQAGTCDGSGPVRAVGRHRIAGYGGTARPLVPQRRETTRVPRVSATLERIRGEIEARLDELRPIVREAAQLEEALVHLDGRVTGASGRGARPPRPRRRRSPPTRAARGQRHREALRLLGDEPGQRASDVARRLGMSSSQASALLRKLAGEGAIVLDGNRYRAAR